MTACLAGAGNLDSLKYVVLKLKDEYKWKVGLLRIDTNVQFIGWSKVKVWIQILWWIMNLIEVGFDCWSNVDKNIKDES